MDRLSAMRLLTRIIDRRSFSAAAADLGIPRSSATTAVRQLENDLGVQLLKRTTRHVVPTPEGEAYYQRCKSILADIEDAEGALTDDVVRGLFRISMNGPMARSLVAPHLPALLARHPRLDLHIGEEDRFIDLVREGYDCVIRGGDVTDSDLIVRRLGLVSEATYASPSYFERHGVPRSIDDLDGHEMVGFVSSRTGQVLPLEFTVAGETKTKLLPCRVTVTNAETYVAFARLGLGLIQAPRYRYKEDVSAGALIECLPEHPPHPMPISVLYPKSRQLSPRVRVFVDWLIEIVPELLH